MTYRHGTTSRYTDGCRCDPCRAAGTLQRKRWKVKNARGVVMRVPADRTRQHISDLRHLMSLRQISRDCGAGQAVVSAIWRGQHTVAPGTADKISRLWDDYCAPIEKDLRRYPVEPLRQHLMDRFGTLKRLGDSERRTLAKYAHTGLSAASADRWAIRYGQRPEDLWADYGQPDMSSHLEHRMAST